MINIREQAHPMDLMLMDKIFASDWYHKTLDQMYENSFDETCSRLMKCSYAPIPGNSYIYVFLEEAKRLFGVDNLSEVYSTREYNFEVYTRGFNTPVLIVPQELILKGDKDIIRARIMAGVASVAMEHHKLEFTLWMLENMGGTVPIPFVSTAVRGFLYEWYRSRKYTMDRAVLLATNDISITLKNILYGEVPFDVLNRMKFGTRDDDFLKQVEKVNDLKGLSGVISKSLGIFQAYDWLPDRYQKVLDFYGNGGEV